MGSDEKVALYPRYCFHLSPTWPVWCFFKASEIHALDTHDGFEGELFFFHKNLPVKWVRVVGLVVAIDDFAGRRVFTIDDSSGACIEAHETLTNAAKLTKTTRTGKPAGDTNAGPSTVSVTKTSAYPEIDVGHVVEVKGGLSEYRDEKQINIEKLLWVRSTMEEVALWEKRTKFREVVLDKPWIIGPRELRKARKEAERDEARAEKDRARATAQEHPKTARYGTEMAPTSALQQRRPLVQPPINLRELLRDNKGKFGALGL